MVTKSLLFKSITVNYVTSKTQPYCRDKDAYYANLISTRDMQERLDSGVELIKESVRSEGGFASLCISVLINFDSNNFAL
jgi:hypothetical protein